MRDSRRILFKKQPDLLNYLDRDWMQAREEDLKMVLLSRPFSNDGIQSLD